MTTTIKRTLFQLVVLACLCVSLGGATVAHASDIDCPTPRAPYAITTGCARAVTTTSSVGQPNLAAQQPTSLDCPTPRSPYGISVECAHAISAKSVSDAFRFTDDAARSGVALEGGEVGRLTP